MAKGKFMENLDKLEKLLRQFPHGARAAELAEKMRVSRSAVYDYLNGLEARGKARNEHGLWYSTAIVQSEPEKQAQLVETEFLADKNRIKEDYVNGRIHQAYIRTMLLVNKGKVSKEWFKEYRHLFKSLDAQEQAIAKNSIEKHNPRRQQEIRRLKTAIVVEALKHWS
jgi:DNA-binding FadR family transcriptional regulator